MKQTEFINKVNKMYNDDGKVALETWKVVSELQKIAGINQEFLTNEVYNMLRRVKKASLSTEQKNIIIPLRVEDRSISEVYGEYSIRCAMEGLEPTTRTTFGKWIRQIHGCESIPRYVSGKTIRVYEKIR